MENWQINPAVLRCGRHDGYQLAYHSKKFESRMVYDYEFEYFLRSEGGVIVDGRFLPFEAGDMNIRKPGQVVRGVPPYECYVVCMDLSGRERGAEYVFGTPEERQTKYDNSLLNAMPDKLSIKCPAAVEAIFERLYTHSMEHGEHVRFEKKAAALQLLAQIVEQLETPQMPTICEGVRAAAQYVRAHYCEAISVGALIEQSGVSRATFHKQFYQECGVSPLRLATHLRIQYAKELLLVTDGSVSEIGVLCGYYDNAYFSRIFQRVVGVAPSEYRALNVDRDD